LEAMDYFESLQTCLDKVKEAGDLQKRIDGIDRDASNLEKEVRAIIQKTTPGMMVLPLDLKLQIRGNHDPVLRGCWNYYGSFLNDQYTIAVPWLLLFYLFGFNHKSCLLTNTIALIVFHITLFYRMVNGYN
jgi:hypothetical protein